MMTIVTWAELEIQSVTRVWIWKGGSYPPSRLPSVSGSVNSESTVTPKRRDAGASLLRNLCLKPLQIAAGRHPVCTPSMPASNPLIALIPLVSIVWWVVRRLSLPLPFPTRYNWSQPYIRMSLPPFYWCVHRGVRLDHLISASTPLSHRQVNQCTRNTVATAVFALGICGKVRLSKNIIKLKVPSHHLNLCQLKVRLFLACEFGLNYWKRKPGSAHSLRARTAHRTLKHGIFLFSTPSYSKHET